MPFKRYKEESRKNWGVTTTNDGLDIKEIQLGAVLRIADATELMATNYQKMQSDLTWYQQCYRERNAEVEILNKRIASLKGVITKLKKKQQ